MDELRRLPESELDLMLALWAGPREGSTAPELLERLDRPLTASALHSYLKRLEEKGFLTCSKVGKTNLYTAKVDKETYQEQEGRSVLKKLYDNSLKRFAAALWDGGAVSDAELKELREYLDELREGRA